MQIQKNLLLAGADNKPILLDIFYTGSRPMPVIIYVHGFNGFKDWANFDLIATQFAENGFCFIKFNFSHGGTSPEAPEEFADPEAYGHNNYTKELYDLQQVIEWALNDSAPHSFAIDKKRVYLIGHSRGGGIALLKTAEEKRIKALTTWASVSQSKTPWGNWPAERLEKWKYSGVDYYTNSRTGQQLPLYYQLYEDYLANSERLDIPAALKRIAVPLLICHGTMDQAVGVENAQALKNAAGNATLFLVDSDHVFGRKHPWPHTTLPSPMQAVVDKTLAFFKSQV